MNSIQKRFLLFIIGCIGIRTGIFILAKYINLEFLPILGYISLLPAIGFLYIYLTGKRLTGPEVFGENIWWNTLRPIHAILYLIFAYNAIHKNPNSWIYLCLDVIIGFISFILYHYTNGNFNKLI